VDQCAVRMRIQVNHLPLQLVRYPRVVRVQIGDQLSPGSRERQVPRSRHAPIGLPQIPDRAPESLHQLPGAVRGAVVHDQHFEIPVALAQGAGEGAGQKGGTVVGGGDHRDPRHFNSSTRAEAALQSGRSGSRPSTPGDRCVAPPLSQCDSCASKLVRGWGLGQRIATAPLRRARAFGAARRGLQSLQTSGGPPGARHSPPAVLPVAVLDRPGPRSDLLKGLHS